MTCELNLSKKYRRFISLGGCCPVAQDLERLGLRDLSMPFDWMITDFEGVIDAIAHRFEGLLDYNNLAQYESVHQYYKNTIYNCDFYHDFDKYRSLKEQLHEVDIKYSKRIDTFYKFISQPTLFIRYILDDVDDKDYNYDCSEMKYIDENHERILEVLRKHNNDNDIIFISNMGVVSQNAIKTYEVIIDENDTVSRRPLFNNSELFEYFSAVEHIEKERNLEWFKIKQKKQSNRVHAKWLHFKDTIKQKIVNDYIHDKQCKS